MRLAQSAWRFGASIIAILVLAAAVAAQQSTPASADQSKDASSAQAQPASAQMHDHVIVQPDQIKWGPTPPGLPSGAEMAVLEGDPSKPGPFTVRVKSSASYTVPPHWHSCDEHVTVLSGTFYIGAGDTIDKSKATELPAGGYTAMPAKMHHYAFMPGPGIIQIHGQGPFDIHYINPTDDPRQK